MTARNAETLWRGLSLVAALAVMVALTPGTALAQGANWKFVVDAENQTPDKLKVDAEGPSLSGTPATGGLTGSFLIEYGSPIDTTLDFPIISSSVAGGVIVVTGGTASAQAVVSINLNTGVASVANVAGAPGLPVGGSPRSFDSALDSLANPGDKLAIELSLDGANLP